MGYCMFWPIALCICVLAISNIISASPNTASLEWYSLLLQTLRRSEEFKSFEDYDGFRTDYKSDYYLYSQLPAMMRLQTKYVLENETVGHSAPQLSIVVCGRNDNYGRNFLQRAQNFFTHLEIYHKAYDLSRWELVIVEWNPTESEKRLFEVLNTGSLPNVRFVTVHKSLHRRLPNSERMSFFEYIAKNVGIRRSRGTFILVTNMDILFSDSLVKTLLERFDSLSTSSFYRIDRHQLSFVPPLSPDVSHFVTLTTMKKCISLATSWDSR